MSDYFRATGSDVAHELRQGAATYCGKPAGPVWDGVVNDEGLPASRCTECMIERMVANGEIRMVTRGRTGGIPA